MSDNIPHAEIAKWIQTRNDTIKILQQLAGELNLMEKRVNISNLAATAGTVVSGIGSVVCFGLAFVTGGISILPGLAFAAVGGGSAVTSVGAFLGKHFHEKDLLKKVQKALDDDRLESERLTKRLAVLPITGRGKESKSRVVRGGIGTAGMVTGSIDVGARIVNTVKGGAKPAARAVSNVAHTVGFVFDVVLLPVDIYILVDTSIKIHKGSTNETAAEMLDIAAKLEKERDAFLDEFSDCN